MSTPEIPETMNAVVCYGPEDYRFEERPVPEPGPGEVLVKVASAGICASDVKCYHGAALFWGDEQRAAYCEPPVIPGHEFAAHVVGFGSGAAEARGLEIGDHVVSEQIVPCHECRYCRRGQYWMCQVSDCYGFRQRTFGAMAEYMVFPEDAIVHRVPASMPATHAAFIEPLACGIHAMQRGGFELGDVVVVAGAGPIGLAIIAAARLKNPGTLIALDVNEQRLDVARACGADLALNPATEDVMATVRDLTDGYGCDVYLEATGHPAAVEQGLHMLRKLGTFVEFSVMREPVTVDWTIIGDTKELNIHGAHLGPYCWPIAIDMISKHQIPLDRLITHVLPLSEFQKGIELVADGSESIKVVLTP
jgi:erythritol/L-threitol dehydrogenase